MTCGCCSPSKRQLQVLVYAMGMTPDQREYSEDGVDLTLIRWMLSLTPAERLEFLEQQINAVLEIRELNGRAQL